MKPEFAFMPRTGNADAEALRGRHNALEAIAQMADPLDWNTPLEALQRDNLEILRKYQATLDWEAADEIAGNLPGVAYSRAYREVIKAEMDRRGLEPADLDLLHLEPISEEDLLKALSEL